MSAALQSDTSPSVVADVTISEHHTLQVVTFAPGITGVIETGRVGDIPFPEVGAAPDATEAEAGKPPADYKPSAAETTDEQTWFRNTYGSGAQAFVQGWDWAYAQTGRPVVNGSGIAFVGSEGSTNANFRFLWWNNGTWVEFWNAIIVPGHWVSNTVTGNNHYIRWELNGAGPNTQVSLAAHY
ncbi:hypothetical protein [Smaragdicoccus niigatensis]|uniref:hypothetical protein n=1 Tax=Smaragdicoccus niigatensis TaxID=359359 RepID=UPI00035E1F8A|nr:hypothetical protein [Smaragdicoccus niigatensis]